MIKERRIYPRIDADITPDELFNIRINEIFKKIGDIKNLSAGGVGLESDNKFNVGDEIFISFKLPGRVKYVDGLGKVVRLEGNQLGIRFIKMDFSDNVNVKMFVKKVIDKEDTSECVIDFHKVM